MAVSSSDGAALCGGGAGRRGALIDLGVGTDGWCLRAVVEPGQGGVHANGLRSCTGVGSG